MNELDLNDVRTFVSVAQAGTLTAAAKELHCPASTLSRALTRLEKHLGVLLVQRGPRGLVMTDAGKEYLQACRRALQSLQHGREGFGRSPLQPKRAPEGSLSGDHGARHSSAIAEGIPGTLSQVTR